MSPTEVTRKMTNRVAFLLVGLLRVTPAQVPGGRFRLEVVNKIRPIGAERPDAAALDLAKYIELTFNREHLGAIKLAFLELWGHHNSNGSTQEQISEVAKALKIWEKHILAALPKEEVPALAELDDEPSLTDSDA